MRVWKHSAIGDTSWSLVNCISLSSTSQQPHNHGDPNPWLFSRSRHAVDVREHGLPLVDHQHVVSLPLIVLDARRAGHYDLHSTTPQLSRLCRWWTAQWSISLPSFSSSGSSARPSFSFVLLSQYLPSRVSPFQYEMVCTVAVDGAPRFLSVFRSRRGSWTLYFRSLTVPLLGSVPSRCRCFTPICAA